jgi:hypothetical protein
MQPSTIVWHALRTSAPQVRLFVVLRELLFRHAIVQHLGSSTGVCVCVYVCVCVCAFCVQLRAYM